MDTLLQDLRQAVRQLVRARGFTTVAALTLALGIGGTTAIFTVVRGVLLRPLPYPQAERLVRVWPTAPSSGEARRGFSVPDFEDWAARTRSLESLGLYSTVPSDAVLTGRGQAQELSTAYVSAGFFETLGVSAEVGRTLLRSEEKADNHVIVLSDAAWRTRFGADRQVVGSPILLEGAPYTVVGVMPPSFGFPSADIEMWMFLSTIPQSSIPLQIRAVRFLDAVGRMKPGVSVEQAQTELSGVASALSEDHPDTNDELTAATVRPLRDTMVGDVRTPLWVLLAATTLILLIACANVANLVLARGTGRRQEIAVRSALGAGPGRLLRQFLVENLVLGLGGGLLGLGLAVWGVDLLVAGSGGLLPRSTEIRPDSQVLLFALGASLLTGLLFGLAPAWGASRPHVSSVLREGGRHTASGHGRARRGLVAAEVALSVVLLAGAGLLLRSLWTLRSVEPGFESRDRLAVTLTISDVKYAERPQYLGFYRELMDRLAALPGVESVASTRYLPLEGGSETHNWTVPGSGVAPERNPPADLLQVSPGFFRTMGIPLLRGRAVEEQDRADTPMRIVISRSLARAAFGDADPIGRTLDFGGPAPVPVVGVVGDVKQRELRAPAPPIVYIAEEQMPRRVMTFVIQTTGEPLRLASAVRRTVAAMDPDQPISRMTTLDQALSESVSEPRFFATLLASFAALALLLAALGVYGVLSYQVRQRTREIGIRIALGARGADVVRLLVRQGMAPVLLGLGVGLAGALALTRLIRGLLFNVTPTDPLTYAGVMLLLTTVALVAAYLPARSGVAGDPVRTLTSE